MQTLGDKLKAIEQEYDPRLPYKKPVFVRLDGNSFSRLTKHKFEKPFDQDFSRAMTAATVAVFNYSNAVFGYTQSDEITLLLRNDQTETTDPFLGNRITKLCILLAARASVEFNSHVGTKAIFDARVFVMDHDEVHLPLVWRQRDCFKNLVSSVVYWDLAKLVGKKQSRRLANGLDTQGRIELLDQYGIDVGDYSKHLAYGVGVYKEPVELPIEDVLEPELYEHLMKKGKITPGEVVRRNKTKVDLNLPAFTKEYVEQFYYQSSKSSESTGQRSQT